MKVIHVLCKGVLLVLLLAMSGTPLQAQQQKKQAAPQQQKTKTVQPKTESVAAKPEPAAAPVVKLDAEPVKVDENQTPTGDDSKLTATPGSKALGMSILGNQEAPTSLVLVPWKTSELGNAPGISTMLDDSRQPIDKEVFMRMLSYYQIRSGPANTIGDATKTNAAQDSTATQRRK